MNLIEHCSTETSVHQTEDQTLTKLCRPKCLPTFSRPKCSHGYKRSRRNSFRKPDRHLPVSWSSASLKLPAIAPIIHHLCVTYPLRLRDVIRYWCLITVITFTCSPHSQAPIHLVMWTLRLNSCSVRSA